MSRHRAQPRRISRSSLGALASGEFRALLAAALLSILGDQLTRVALAVLVYRRTGSALLTAAIYSVSFLPWALGGPFLAGLADRFPRRTVMVACDLGRMLLILALVLPLPVLPLCGLLFASELLASPFHAARSATLPDALAGDSYVQGLALTNIALQAGQVIGFAVAGAIVAALGPAPALVVDAGTFALSAALLRLGVPWRAPANAGAAAGGSLLAGTRAGARLVFGSPVLRGLVTLAWLCAFVVVPEGLAVPYANTLHRGPAAAGLLLAAHPLGFVLGSLLVTRLLPDRRLRLMGCLAVVSCLPLLGFAARPGLGVAVVLLVISGLGSAYNLPANAAFVGSVPKEHRGQAFGLVQSGIFVFQGVALLLAGVATTAVSVPTVIALAGGLGLGLAVWLAGTALRPGGEVLRQLATDAATYSAESART